MRALWPALAVLALGCTGVVSPLGLDEPIRVDSAILREGSLPTGTDGPAITSVATNSGVWGRGQYDLGVLGRADEETYAIALRLRGVGSGYWTVPVGALDPAYPGERSWGALVDVGGGLPAGVYALEVVAIDGEGRAGAVSSVDVCVVDLRLPDNLNACDPRIPPPAATVTIEWDERSDVDLVVVTPEGKVVDASRPTTAYAGPGRPLTDAMLSDPTIGRLDGDSNAECHIDGRNTESLVFAELPDPGGVYNVFANLYDACGHPSVRFVVTTYRRAMSDDGTYRVVQTDQRSGVLLQLSANGGAGQPLYVTSVVLP